MDKPPRKPRFERCPDKRQVEITDRDAEIVRHVQKHRFLRSTHLAQLVGGSPQNVLRRLQLLFHHGYLDRPRAQLEYYSRSGSQPMVFALGNRGADLLTDRFGLVRGKRVDWNAKNRDVGPLFIEHTLLIADVMVALELACRKAGNVRLIEPDELLDGVPEATRRKPYPFVWDVTFRHHGERFTLGIIPDKVFGLHFLDEEEGSNKAYFFLEADRSTMPVMRRLLTERQTSFYRKLVCYYESWSQKLQEEHFGFRNCRTLTVAARPGRLAKILEACGRVNGGQLPRLFLFADRQSVVSQDVLSMPWRIGGSDETTRLID